MNIHPEQKPRPGYSLIFREGDFLKIELSLASAVKGKAYVRTNLFNPAKKRQEIVEKAEKGIPRRYQEWGNYEMTRKDNRTYYIEIPLTEVGFFEAKAYYMPDEEKEPVWPEGGNLQIKVEPAITVTGNSIYSAFVRLFAEEENISNIKYKLENQTLVKDQNFNVIPESGKFRNLIQRLDFIIEELGFDIIMLLPIHPVPTTYARMGLFGSPYATLDFYSVDPALAVFDKESTPLEQFQELIDEVHARHARIFMDIPGNHTGWASQLQIHHPEYFVKNKEGKFVSPGAWGVTWSDLSELDYSNHGLWEYMADIFLFWCGKGVDGFRCDAGYMVPAETWKYIIAKVRDEYPSTVFLLEGLGGKVRTTEALLTDSNMNWAYSEIFQNYDQSQIEWYLEEYYKRISFEKGPLVNFSETHDNNRLASVSKAFSQLRNGLLALLSDTGTFGITCGVEWFADEKIDVHRMTSLKWGNKSNQVQFLKRINDLLKTHHVFHSKSKPRKIHTSQCNSIAYLRDTEGSNDKLAVIANLSDENNSVYIDKKMFEPFYNDNTDLLTGESINYEDNGKDLRVNLKPLQIIALSNNIEYLKDIDQRDINKRVKREKANRILRRQIMKLFENTKEKIDETFVNEKTEDFKKDPHRFFYDNFEEPPSVIKWVYPQDLKRQVVVPDNTPILIICTEYFRFQLKNKGKTIDTGEGFFLGETNYVAVINPCLLLYENIYYQLKIEVFGNNGIIKRTGNLIKAAWENLFASKNSYSRKEIQSDVMLSSLMVNSRSGISAMRGAFSTLKSKYDALIAANLSPLYPEDKHIMLTRFRGWTVFQGFSRDMVHEYQKTFEHYGNTTEYYFEMPAGEGCLIPVSFIFKFDEHENLLNMTIKRLQNKDLPLPPSDKAAKIILRPDIESRNHHELTKAYAGPENEWPKQVKHNGTGFLFTNDKNRLILQVENGTFIREDEWQYMVSHTVDKERGMDDKSDLYSPGYFLFYLKANEEALIYAHAQTKREKRFEPGEMKKLSSDIKSLPLLSDPRNVLKSAMRKFIVTRNTNKTVIAGYPWFLDWGRDTLICLRGIIAAGFLREAEQIVKEFASFEDKGTLPNVIRGGDTSNRDTSDAPLWFFVAVGELMKNKNEKLLQTNCNGRSLKEVLKSIAENYIAGTPNGIKMDDESALIYSPVHFTWMDTNYPAGTPREGYPVEIQSLWYYALKLLKQIYPKEKKWNQLSKQVSESILKYFLIQSRSNKVLSENRKYLSDCLHTKGFQPASEGKKDDHIRPNQLFAVTFNAIKEKEVCREILSACTELVVPGAIRTLADRDVAYELPVYFDNKLINNASHPYCGRYTGNEDTSRKPAYHNGTAWTWPFPSYCEALVMVYGKKARNKAKDILSTSFKLLNEGCINQIPEILDGDYPHDQKGCYAQAWGITELYRVSELLNMI